MFRAWSISIGSRRYFSGYPTTPANAIRREISDVPFSSLVVIDRGYV